LESDWIDMPAAAGEAPQTVSATAYWAGFHDATLIRLLQKGDDQSPNLLSSVELITQARQQVRIDVGNLLPAVQVSAGSNYAAPTIASELQGKNLGATTDQLLGQLNWEIDFWGRVRRALESDRASLQSAQAGLAAARVSLEASVASAYVNVRMTERRIEVAESNLKQQAEDKRIAAAKYRLGATSELDFRQAEAQYEQTNSQLPALRQSLAQYQHSLSVLVGETPDYFARHEPAGTGLPTVPADLPIGAPRDLLRRRPDVLQAELNAAAQSARIGVAKAALYPTFSLTGQFGYATTGNLGTLFRWNNRAVQYGGGFTIPIFDRGQLVAQVRIQDSLFRQAVLAYQNQVLTAQQDVEDGLASVTGQTAQAKELALADSAAARAAALALLQYRAGQVDYTTVSTAEQTHAQTSDALVQAQAGVLQAHITVFRAIGGGWESGNSADLQRGSRMMSAEQ
jgi:NodT family efflux transporter outer membrane factor (OMF) lipoprotein